MNYSRAAMKQEVKQAMRQARPHPMLVTLLYLVVVSTVAGIISWLINLLIPSGNTLLNELVYNIQTYGEDYLEYMLVDHPEIFIQTMVLSGTASLLVSILTTAWSGLMNVGYSGYCLDLSRSTNPGFERIFSGFPRAGSVILAYILVAIFTFLWSMLFGIGLGVLLGIAFVIGANDSLAILGVLLMFTAIVLYAVALIWVTYRYAMVPFAIIDSQNSLSAMDAIRVSKTIMKGRKGSFFVLRISFIGWYLLEYLVIVVGVIVSIVAAAGAFVPYADAIEDMFGYGYVDMNWLLSTLSQSLIIILPVILLCSAAIFVINLWLTPYLTSCEARFYIYATGGAQPIQPSPYQPGPYGGQPGPYGGQPGPYGGQSGQYSRQPSQYGGQPGQYGGRPGPYNNNPYGYNPPSQSSFGGYTQAGQPPQYGTGTYSQWGAPQAPEIPAAPAEPAGDMYEAPYAEPEASSNDDGTPQPPNGPSYPQY